MQRSVLEAAVRDWLREWAEDIDRAAEIEKARAGAVTRARADAEVLGREVARIDRAVLKSARDQALDESTPASVFETARKELLAQRVELAAALEAARKAQSRGNLEFRPLAAAVTEEWDVLPAARLREMLKSLIREIRVTRTGVRVPPDIRVIPVWEQDEDSSADNGEV